MALKYFDELLRKLTDEERLAVSEFVAETPSYTVYTNLSRRTETRVNPLSERGLPQSSSAEMTETYARSGLDWVMALARVEYASILAAFTTTPNPYVTVRPSKFEMSAYKELLTDGARMHYFSLYRDPVLKKVKRSSPENPVVLSYSRRLGLARKMLTAVAKAGIGEMNPYQYRELASWKKDLDGLHGGLLAVIQSYLKTVEQRSTSTMTEEEREFALGCGAQLRGLDAELKSGTAKVYKLKSK